MMISTYKTLFEQISQERPEQCKSIIQTFLDLIVEFYETNTALATVEILGIMHNYRNDPITQIEFQDIYQRYGNTHFLVREMRKEDIKYIKERYLQGLSKLGKEYGCVIQTKGQANRECQRSAS